MNSIDKKLDKMLTESIKTTSVTESTNFRDNLDPKSGLAVLVYTPYEGADVYGIRSIEEANNIKKELKTSTQSIGYLVKIVKKFN